MRIRIWSAFASNNSGSYTLVGRFDSIELAREVADVLRPVLEAESRYREAHDGGPDSPLSRFVSEQGLPVRVGDDDWPHAGGTEAPGILVVNHQVLLHHPYTVTLPRVLGQFLVARGGQIEATLDHAHHHVVVAMQAWWDRDEETRRRLTELHTATRADLAPLLATHADPQVPPVIRDDECESLLVAAVFRDLVAGVDAVRAAVERHEGHVHLRVHEALGRGDPLASLRPTP